jgi:hypothetical protein
MMREEHDPFSRDMARRYAALRCIQEELKTTKAPAAKLKRIEEIMEELRRVLPGEVVDELNALIGKK